MLAAERILVALGRLQGAAEGTPFEPLVKDLVDAMAADTTAADLRQEIEFIKAEHTAKITRQNLRRVYTDAMAADDEETLELVYAYLRDHGWAGGITPEEAISAIAS